MLDETVNANMQRRAVLDIAAAGDFDVELEADRFEDEARSVVGVRE